MFKLRNSFHRFDDFVWGLQLPRSLIFVRVAVNKKEDEIWGSFGSSAVYDILKDESSKLAKVDSVDLKIWHGTFSSCNPLRENFL